MKHDELTQAMGKHKDFYTQGKINKTQVKHRRVITGGGKRTKGVQSADQVQSKTSRRKISFKIKKAVAVPL